MVKFVKQEPPETEPAVTLRVIRGAFDGKTVGIAEYSQQGKKSEEQATVVQMKPIKEAIKEALKMCSENVLTTVYVDDPKDIYDFDLFEESERT